MPKCRRKQKQKFADYLIDTSEGFESARKRTGEVYEELRRVKIRARASRFVL